MSEPYHLSTEIARGKLDYKIYDLADITIEVYNISSETFKLKEILGLIPFGFILADIEIKPEIPKGKEIEENKSEVIEKVQKENKLNLDVDVAPGKQITVKLTLIAFESKEGRYQPRMEIEDYNGKTMICSSYQGYYIEIEDIPEKNRIFPETPNVKVEITPREISTAPSAKIKFEVKIQSFHNTRIDVIELKNFFPADIIKSGINFKRSNVFYVPSSGSIIVREPIAKGDTITFTREAMLKGLDYFCNRVVREYSINPTCYVLDGNNVLIRNPNTAIAKPAVIKVALDINPICEIYVDDSLLQLDQNVEFNTSSEKERIITYKLAVNCGIFQDVSLENPIPREFTATLENKDECNAVLIPPTERNPWIIQIPKLNKEPVSIKLKVILPDKPQKKEYSVIPTLILHGTRRSIRDRELIFIIT